MPESIKKKIDVPTAITTLLMASSLLFAGVLGYYSGYNAYAQNNSNNNKKLSPNDFQVTKPSPDLTERWWQWAASYPRDESPITDTTGERCSQGDFGDIFFLAGSEGSGKVERNCTVTEGQAILIPIVNALCYVSEPGDTQQSLLAQCREFMDQQKNLKLIIDGQKVQNLETNYRVTNPTFFIVDFAENNIFGAPAGSDQAVADGYWALIEGLSPGEHTISVVGKLHGQSSIGKIDFKTDVTYHLTVE